MDPLRLKIENNACELPTGLALLWRRSKYIHAVRGSRKSSILGLMPANMLPRGIAGEDEAKSEGERKVR